MTVAALSPALPKGFLFLLWVKTSSGSLDLLLWFAFYGRCFFSEKCRNFGDAASTLEQEIYAPPL